MKEDDLNYNVKAVLDKDNSTYNIVAIVTDKFGSS